jgi:hypothetical protein
MGYPGINGKNGKNGVNVSGTNYLNAIKINTQLVTSANIFTNVLWSMVPQNNNWVVTSGGNLTCQQTGVYLINYTVNMSSIHGPRQASVRSCINGTEINGSAITKGFQLSSAIEPWYNSFITNIINGQKISVQFAGDFVGDISIDTYTPIAGEIPVSSSLTILRLN